MSTPATETNIEEVASALALRREQGQRTVLFLGSRTGGLFGNEFLYETLKQFSLVSFNKLSKEEKFKACYDVLNKQFTDNDRHDILVGTLATLRYREEDEFLAALIKAGFFEIIISTNIDTLLEDACNSRGLRESHDYRVFNPALHQVTEIERNQPTCCNIIKVFGDLTSWHYGPDNFKAGSEWQSFLEAKLAQDTLIVGYDPVWDHALEQVFPLDGKTLWHINETGLPQDARLLTRRDHRILQGDLGSYSSFFRALYGILGKSVSRIERVAAPETVMPLAPNSSTKRVFISYSSQDRPYLERLITHLKGYMLKDAVDLWDDANITPGTEWQKEIEQVLTQAKVAVLLVSPDFLSIEGKNELPILQEAAQRGDVQLFPIIIDANSSTSLLRDSEPLSQYQVVNSSSKPMKSMKPYEQEVVWNKLAEQVYDILCSPE